jgi:hypothetical protein
MCLRTTSAVASYAAGQAAASKKGETRVSDGGRAPEREREREQGEGGHLQLKLEMHPRHRHLRWGAMADRAGEPAV